MHEALLGVAAIRRLGLARARGTADALRAAVAAQRRLCKKGRHPQLPMRCLYGPWEGFHTLEAVLLGLRKGGVDDLVTRGVVRAEVREAGPNHPFEFQRRMVHCAWANSHGKLSWRDLGLD